MADIFMSYKRADHELAYRLILALSTGEGRWFVWRDKGIGTGKPWSKAWTQFIERELFAAKCVMVIWSRRSLEAYWVRHNARVGRERGCLLQVVIDGVGPPAEFQSLPVIDLSQWQTPGFTRISDIHASVRQIAGEGSVPPYKSHRPPKYLYPVTDSTEALACLDRGSECRLRGDFARAITEYNKAIELDSKLAAAYRLRAASHYEEKNYDCVIADCCKVIEIDPEDAYCGRLSGMARAQKQDYDGAIADFDRTIALNPHEGVPALYYGRGRAYEAKGELDAAILSYTNGIETWELGGHAPEAYLWRARAYEDRASTGDRERAVIDYLTVLQGNPAYGHGYEINPVRKIAEEALERLSAAS